MLMKSGVIFLISWHIYSFELFGTLIFLKAQSDPEESQKCEIQFACARPQHILTPDSQPVCQIIGSELFHIMR
jgi:hypothetical protein